MQILQQNVFIYVMFKERRSIHPAMLKFNLRPQKYTTARRIPLTGKIGEYIGEEIEKIITI